MILPGETEAGTAGTQPCRGIARWAHRDDARGVSDPFSRRPKPPSDRKTPCLENPRPKGGILTNGELASPFQAEPRQDRPGVRAGICARWHMCALAYVREGPSVVIADVNIHKAEEAAVEIGANDSAH